MKNSMEKGWKHFTCSGLGGLFLMCLCLASSPAWAQPTQQTKTAALAPVVVKTTPASGDQNVAPSLKELQITFSQKMTDKDWSLVKTTDETFPKINGTIHYLADQKTLVVPLQLEPDKDYVLWVNSEKYHNFKDLNGTPAVPYLLKFHTKK